MIMAFSGKADQINRTVSTRELFFFASVAAMTKSRIVPKRDNSVDLGRIN